ncbi:Mov34/MPN/PAD-1 family protein [Perkinsela sp. CCAP 1560/4]|nr:Mov34/MPN/PAD-1 family protein [Perkinsela sp. CCAP 1560/4]KNH04360.1 Mov34/MPN/PAD-1 family protein [Perkinsela sp. CCAP 1560/4]|eukprot:KNH04095.1 Mov34/MPN/PAD-1 family protein [Perkinsela sp. CCAP 1560/4]
MSTIQQDSGPDEVLAVPKQASVSSARIAPNVILSILDHHMRRGEKQTRVIGGLYGILKSDIIEVRHVIPILHTEVENQNATLELGGWQKRMQLGKKINLPPLIGWYATGSQPGDMALDKIFSTRTAIYVRLLLDGGLAHDGLRIRVLGNTTVTIGDTTEKIYQHIPFHFVPTNAIEANVLRSAVGSLFPERAILNTDESLSAVQKLHHEIARAIELLQTNESKLSAGSMDSLMKTLEELHRGRDLRGKLVNSAQDLNSINFLAKSIDLLLSLIKKVMD